MYLGVASTGAAARHLQLLCVLLQAHRGNASRTSVTGKCGCSNSLPHRCRDVVCNCLFFETWYSGALGLSFRRSWFQRLPDLRYIIHGHEQAIQLVETASIAMMFVIFLRTFAYGIYKRILYWELKSDTKEG